MKIVGGEIKQANSERILPLFSFSHRKSHITCRKAGTLSGLFAAYLWTFYWNFQPNDRFFSKLIYTSPPLMIILKSSESHCAL
jgi:hypothetical protein